MHYHCATAAQAWYICAVRPINQSISMRNLWFVPTPPPHECDFCCRQKTLNFIEGLSHFPIKETKDNVLTGLTLVRINPFDKNSILSWFIKIPWLTGVHVTKLFVSDVEQK